jgi:RNA polymerase subunit RPABC4/transcription elongation factor Spt4
MKRCWLCNSIWDPREAICPYCKAIDNELSEEERDEVIYGPGKWLPPR